MAVFELVVEVIQDLVERDSPVLPPSQETNISDVRRFDDDTRLKQSRIYRGDKDLSIQLVTDIRSIVVIWILINR